MMCNHLLWVSQVEEFGSSRDVVVGDLSHGESIEAIAAYILERAPTEFILAGISMGGIVAFEIWKLAPERVKGLALLDTNAKADSQERKKVRVRQIRDARQGLLERIIINELKPDYMAPIHRYDKELLATLMQMAVDLGVDVFERQSLALMNRSAQIDVLETITCPVEVLCGEEDFLCPVEFHQILAGLIPDAHLTVLQDCGHVSSMEAPIRVNNMLENLILRVERA